MTLLPDHLGGEEALQIYVSMHRLRERVLDPGLRASILEFIDLCYAGGTGARGLPPEQAIAQVRRQFDLVGSRYAVLSEQIGEHLRRELDRRILVRDLAADTAGA